MASRTRGPSIPILTDIYYLFIDDKAALLMEFIWRRNHEHELWNRILFAMSEIIYIEDEDDNEEPKQEEIEEISNFLDSIQLK